MNTRPLLSIILGLAFASYALAGMIESNQLHIDFSKAEEATKKARWPKEARLSITPEGLGWEAETEGGGSIRRVWIRTAALPAGLAWRPATWVYCSVTLTLAKHRIVLGNGRSTRPYEGSVFARYSPDLHHWSTWQPLTPEPSSLGKEAEKEAHRFTAKLGVPEQERATYLNYLRQYEEFDVPWASDEEAAVRWIVEKEPDFFSKHLPFIGYVEFLYEATFHNGQRIASFDVDISYALNGMYRNPKNPEAVRSRIENPNPWAYKAEKAPPASGSPDPSP